MEQKQVKQGKTFSRQGNLMELEEQLEFMGVHRYLTDLMEENIKIGKPYFDLPAFQEEGVDKLAIRLHFEKDENNNYGLKNYRLTLYDPVNIDKVHLSNPHQNDLRRVLKELESKMHQTDWYYDLAEEIPQWTEGYKETNHMEEELRLLSHHVDGERIAVYLWNNHVPPAVVDKPAFISRIEERLGLYPGKLFPAETKVNEAYLNLKDCRRLEEYFANYSIVEFKDKDTRIPIIDKLLLGERQIVTFEKGIIPAEHIDNFIVVTHDYSIGYINHPNYDRIKEVGSFPDFDAALNLLHSKAAELVTEKPIIHEWDIMVIGRYRNKQLEYNFEGTPDANTGHILATAYPISIAKHPHRYELLLSEDLNQKIKVHESLYVQRDSKSRELVFSDILNGQKQIDEVFWRKNTSSNISNAIDEKLLKKNPVNRKDSDLIQEKSPEGILTKLTNGSDRGIKR